ncbi:hypothetical protein T484DRAFT_1768872 [Baffinella frigidus]|nr:hypothetical protein T484DRAFT_1768872 [Cryptophyta sp. CCMP2293]
MTHDARHTTHVRAVAFRPDGLLLATSSYDGQIPEPQRKFKCIETLTAGCDVPSLSFGRGKNNGILVAATRKGEVFTWDTAPFLPMMATLEPDHYHANLAASSATMSPMSFARQQHANSQHANSQHLMGMSSKAAFPASSYFTNTSAGGFSPAASSRMAAAHLPYHTDEQSYASKLAERVLTCGVRGGERA